MRNLDSDRVEHEENAIRLLRIARDFCVGSPSQEAASDRATLKLCAMGATHFDATRAAEADSRLRGEDS